MESEETTPRSIYENNRITISGQLKDSERGNHLNCITRCCQIRVGDLKFTSDVGLPPAVTFIISLNKVRRTIRTPPIDLPLESREGGNLDMRITFLYTHSLKEFDDTLRIQIQANMKKKQRNDVIIAYTTLDLALVLQNSMQDEEIVFRAGTGEREGGRFHHDKDKSSAEQASSTSQPFAVMHASVWSYPEEIETVEDANDYELVPENLTDDEEYGDSGGESMDDEDILPSISTGPIGNSAPNTPSKTLLSQRLIQQALEKDFAPSKTKAASGATGTSTNAGGNANANASANASASKQNKSRLRHLWLSSKPILTRVKSKESSDSDNVEAGSDQELDQYFESSSNSEPSDNEDRLSPGIEFTPPASPNTTRPTLEYSNSTPTSPTFIPPLPQWGSSKELFSEKLKDNPLGNQSANTSFTIPSNPPSATTSQANLLPNPNAANATNVSTNASTAPTSSPATIPDAMRSNPNSPPTLALTGANKLVQSSELAAGGELRIILINGAKWRGRKLEDCLTHFAPLPPRYHVVCTKRSADVQAVITGIFARNQQLVRVAIAGSDGYINEVLRPFVEQLGKKPRGWDSLHFYILPIGKNNNDLAMQVALHDPTYKSLFFTRPWQQAFQQRELCSDDECQELQQRILQYLDEDATVPVRFPIGEAFITYPDSAGKAVPFLKGVHIADLQPFPTREAPQAAQAQDDEHDGSNMQLDYWVPKKKGPSEDHLEFKGSFQFAAVTRLPSVATALRIAPEFRPTPSALSLLVQARDRKGRKNVLARHFAQLGKKGGKDEKEKGKGGDKDGKTAKKKDDKDSQLTALVTKLVCSVVNDNSVFRASIDGVEYPGVKFVSLSPQWANHVKTFTVQAFACEGDNAATTPAAPASATAAPLPVNASSTSLLGASAASTSNLQAPSSGTATPVAGGSTPVNRGSPVMGASQVAFPPLNLNAVKAPGSPLTQSKHSSTGLQPPSGMAHATDL